MWLPGENLVSSPQRLLIPLLTSEESSLLHSASKPQRYGSRRAEVSRWRGLKQWQGELHQKWQYQALGWHSVLGPKWPTEVICTPQWLRERREGFSDSSSDIPLGQLNTLQWDSKGQRGWELCQFSRIGLHWTLKTAQVNTVGSGHCQGFQSKEPQGSNALLLQNLMPSWETTWGLHPSLELFYRPMKPVRLGFIC